MTTGSPMLTGLIILTDFDEQTSTMTTSSRVASKNVLVMVMTKRRGDDVSVAVMAYIETRCICETPMPPQRPVFFFFFENCDLDISP